MRVFVHPCIINLFFCCCLAIRLHVYIYIQTNLLPLASTHAVLADEDRSCNSCALGVPVHCAACYSSSSRLRLLFLLLSLACSRVVSWNAWFSFFIANLEFFSFFSRRDLTKFQPWQIPSVTSLLLLLSPLSTPHIFMYVCVFVYMFEGPKGFSVIYLSP